MLHNELSKRHQRSFMTKEAEKIGTDLFLQRCFHLRSVLPWNCNTFIPKFWLVPGSPWLRFGWYIFYNRNCVFCRYKNTIFVNRKVSAFVLYFCAVAKPADSISQVVSAKSNFRSKLRLQFLVYTLDSLYAIASRIFFEILICVSASAQIQFRKSRS